jgi:ATP-dependent Clp protease adaptor protein ClpS
MSNAHPFPRQPQTHAERGAPAGPQREREREIDIDVATDTTVWLEPPYRVLIHNDDKTTFDFVIRILIQIFKQTKRHAERIANITHVTGVALVCVRPQGEAERLVNQATFAARLEGFPLKVTCEPEAI